MSVFRTQTCRLRNDLQQDELAAWRPRQLDRRLAYLRAGAEITLATSSVIRQHEESEPDEVDRLFRGVS